MIKDQLRLQGRNKCLGFWSFHEILLFWSILESHIDTNFKMQRSLQWMSLGGHVSPNLPRVGGGMKYLTARGLGMGEEG